MIPRRIIALVVGLAIWTTLVAAIGVANMPRGIWPYAQAHAPGFILQIYVIWLVVPAAFWLLLVLQTPPVRSLLVRLFNGSHPPPPDRAAWAARMIPVTGLFTAFGQLWQTAALVLLWHRRQLPWVAEVLRQGPHWAAIPDPHHWIARTWPALGGLLIAWFGNSLPKLLTPFRGRVEPYDWTRMMRSCGWAMTLGGLVGAACSLLIPDLRTALVATATIFITTLYVAPVLIWLSYRLGGRHNGVAPTEGA